MTTRYPDFYIVGAPKCGTTTLARHLNETQGVRVAYDPEPCHFALEIPSAYRQDEQTYLANFAEHAQAPLWGDKSPDYLYSAVATREIQRARPDAKIIIALRPPADLIASLHAQCCWNHRGETVLDLRTALELEPARAERRNLPEGFDGPTWTLLYRRAGHYVQDVQRWVDAFGSERVQVLLLEDLQADSRRVYENTCAFLGVQPRTDLQPRADNQRKYYRYPAIRQFLEGTKASPLRGFARSLVPVSVRRKLVPLMMRWNQRAGAPPQQGTDQRLMAELRREFVPEVERLEAFLGRDLSHWKPA